MKKILIVIPAYNHGGTNKSLLNLISCLDKEKYKIDILSMSDVGPYKEILPQENLLEFDLLLCSIFDNIGFIKKERFMLKFSKIFIKILFRILLSIFGTKLYSLVYSITAIKYNKNKYDTVIAMQEGRATHFSSNLHGNKVAWVRSDYSHYYNLNKIDELNIYRKFNDIVCVSRYTKDIFVSFYPSLKNKCHGIHNMIDTASIKKLSLENIEDQKDFDTNDFTIISIGRLSKVKRFELIPQIASSLKKEKLNFVWYILGDGEERDKIKNLIELNNVNKYVKLLGAKTNPYPYLKSSNLLVSTSISEACPNVINEAKILNIPVVTTNYGSAFEFIDNGENGLIVNENEIIHAIKKIAYDRKFNNKIINNIMKFNYDNSNIITKIEKIL